MQNEINGIYRHFKGNYYEVLGTAQVQDNPEQLVLYRQLYAPFGYWLRPQTMFFGERMTENGYVARFQKVGTCFEEVLKTADIASLTITHSETEKQYRICKQTGCTYLLQEK